MAENEFILTEEQQKVLDIKKGIHLVLAPPGSGKTELLALRVEKAIQSGYKDDEIICLTFTNRAAKGMAVRIDQKYPANKIMIGNIHHFCSRFLAENRLLPENYSILDEEDADALIQEVKNEFGYFGDALTSELLKYATLLKQKSLGFSDNVLLRPDLAKIENRELAQSVCEEYTKRKATYGFLDFDDLLTKTYQALSNNEMNYKMSQFTWLQVDEVQDLNPMQWAIIEKIRDKNAVTVYFGDYEQAIFSFMGAQLASLHKIEAICKSDAKNGIHNLQKNFRSPSYLLDIYTDYVKAHFKPVWKKEPVASKIKTAEEGSLGLYEVDGTLNDEAKYIVDKLIPNLPGQKAIIVRYNQTADIISSYLKDRNIPHFRISGYDLFRRESVKGLMAFLSVLENPFDKLSWARLYYNSGAIDTLKDARHFSHGMLQIAITPLYLFENNNLPPLIEKQIEYFTNENVKNTNDEFIRKFGGLFSIVLSQMNSQTTLDELIEEYFSYLCNNGLMDKEDYNEEKTELSKLLNHVKHFTQVDNNLTLKERIKKYVPEYRQMKESDLFFGSDDILLTTVHKAKGLEFENVIIAEATDSIYPNWRQTNIEEDARALYVAMTRAKKRLYITYHNRFVNQFGKIYEREMSRFLEAVEKHFGNKLPDKSLLLIREIFDFMDDYDEADNNTKSITNLAVKHPDFFIKIIESHYPLSEELIGKYQEKWNFSYMSENENISWSIELIEKYKSKIGTIDVGLYEPILMTGMADRWDWTKLSKNKSLPWSNTFIEKYEKKWASKMWNGYKYIKADDNYFFGLSMNENIPWSIELIEKYKERWNWGQWDSDNYYIKGLSDNQGIPWSIELILKFIEKWDWNRLSMNKTFPWSIELIKTFLDKWNWNYLSSNESIPWGFILIDEFIDRWNWKNLSSNNSLPWTYYILSRYVNKWDWHHLSDNKSLPWSIDLIEKFKDKWNWVNLSFNPSLPWSIDLFEKYRNKWCIFLASNPSFQLIEKYKDEWDWTTLPANPLFPWSVEFIEKNIDRLNWSYLSANPSVPWSIELINKYKDKWDWKELSKNPMLPWSDLLIDTFKEKWDWHTISWCSLPIPWTFELIEKYKDKWNWDALGRHNLSVIKLFLFYFNDDLIEQIMNKIVINGSNL